jgi:hypothetical protein
MHNKFTTLVISGFVVVLALLLYFTGLLPRYLAERSIPPALQRQVTSSLPTSNPSTPTPTAHPPLQAMQPQAAALPKSATSTGITSASSPLIPIIPTTTSPATDGQEPFPPSAQMRTYTNVQNGFSLEYQPGVNLDPTISHAIVSFSYTTTNGAEGALLLGADSDIIDTKTTGCLTGAGIQTNINGVPVRVFDRSDASSGYEYYARFYLFFTSGQCFAVVEQVSSGSDTAADDERQVFNAFDPVLRSLRFSK